MVYKGFYLKKLSGSVVLELSLLISVFTYDIPALERNSFIGLTGYWQKYVLAIMYR